MILVTFYCETFVPYNHTILTLVYGLAWGTRPCSGDLRTLNLGQHLMLPYAILKSNNFRVGQAFRRNGQVVLWTDWCLLSSALLQAFFASKPVAKRILVACNPSFLKNNVKRKRRRVLNAWWRNSPGFCERYGRYTYLTFLFKSFSLDLNCRVFRVWPHSQTLFSRPFRHWDSFNGTFVISEVKSEVIASHHMLFETFHFGDHFYVSTPHPAPW